jgi:hypothetical protein
MTWTDISDSAFADEYFEDNDYVVSGYVEGTWERRSNDDGTWTPRSTTSTTWS